MPGFRKSGHIYLYNKKIWFYVDLPFLLPVVDSLIVANAIITGKLFVCDAFHETSILTYIMQLSRGVSVTIMVTLTPYNYPHGQCNYCNTHTWYGNHRIQQIAWKLTFMKFGLYICSSYAYIQPWHANF